MKDFKNFVTYFIGFIGLLFVVQTLTIFVPRILYFIDYKENFPYPITTGLYESVIICVSIALIGATLIFFIQKKEFKKTTKQKTKKYLISYFFTGNENSSGFGNTTLSFISNIDVYTNKMVQQITKQLNETYPENGSHIIQNIVSLND